MASIRADIVDGLLADAGVSALVGTRVIPFIFTFEDMLNAKANNLKFPRITVEMLSREQEDNLSTHDHLYNATLQISLYHEVKTNSLRNRNNSRVVLERNKIRTSLDALYDAVETYLCGLRNTVLNDHFIRKSHIQNTVEEEFKIDKNRTIISDRLNYECIFSK
tara:strand:- start:1355 stop:1846 length:492 start_codon:yes stop_codon:yes gene_type:complete